MRVLPEKENKCSSTCASKWTLHLPECQDPLSQLTKFLTLCGPTHNHSLATRDSEAISFRRQSPNDSAAASSTPI
ncbi:hypothetical protein VNO78_03207 [Psophocarpus tetragonolobus]|uniref:Uncharacterized protein n=1 Tax=Psophocarpus tetragonolobus TaxID=3891 RepID=A0AAN9T0S1_PSOTE